MYADGNGKNKTKRRVKKYIVHFIIWGLGIISYYILDKTTAGDQFQNISVLLRGIIRMCEQVAASGNTLILYSA